jgi:hypothetical protein
MPSNGGSGKVIDLSLFQIGGKSKTKKMKQEKKKKRIASLRPNKVKEKLLKKIREHASKRRTDVRGQESKKDEKTKDVLVSHAEETMNYLKAIAERKRQRQEQQAAKRLQAAQQQVPNVPQVSNVPRLSEVPRVSEVPQVSNVPRVSEVPRVSDVPQVLAAKIPQPSQNIDLEVEVIEIETSKPEPLVPLQPSPVPLQPAPEWGCLKGGQNPTYRIYHNKTLRRKPTQNSIDYRKNGQGNTRSRVRRHKQKKQRTIRKKYKLGRDRKTKKVGVFVPDNKTRKQRMNELHLLKQKTIQEVKQYLKERNLIRPGSNAPNDVLRTMYEAALFSIV